MSESQAPKSDEQVRFEDKMRQSKPMFDTHGLYWRYMFGWVTPIVSAAKKFGLNLDMLPNLSREFRHQNYANKIRFHFQRLLQEHRSANKPLGKYFILKLLYRSFRFDIWLVLLFVTVLTIMEYSSPYFLLQILSIQQNYDKAEYLEMFVKFSAGLVITKVINSILNDNVYFYMVG